MKELPREGEQFGGGHPRRSLSVGSRAFRQLAVHFDGEAALRAFGVPPPGDSFPNCDRSERGLEQSLSPYRQVLLDVFRALLEYADRPESNFRDTILDR